MSTKVVVVIEVEIDDAARDKVGPVRILTPAQVATWSVHQVLPRAIVVASYEVKEAK